MSARFRMRDVGRRARRSCIRRRQSGALPRLGAWNAAQRRDLTHGRGAVRRFAQRRAAHDVHPADVRRLQDRGTADAVRRGGDRAAYRRRGVAARRIVARSRARVDRDAGAVHAGASRRDVARRRRSRESGARVARACDGRGHLDRRGLELGHLGAASRHQRARGSARQPGQRLDAQDLARRPKDRSGRRCSASSRLH